MDKYSLLFESPPWLIGVGVLLGLGYAALLYFRTKVIWGKYTNYLLAGLRFLMVTQLTLLLFGPLIRQIQNSAEYPSIVFAVDNSQSIAQIEDSTGVAEVRNKIGQLKEVFENEGYLTEIRTIGAVQNEVKDIYFDQNSSNLNAMLKSIQNDYESRNISNVVLFSDGLYNLGNNPAFNPYNFPMIVTGGYELEDQAILRCDISATGLELYVLQDDGTVEGERVLEYTITA